MVASTVTPTKDRSATNKKTNNPFKIPKCCEKGALTGLIFKNTLAVTRSNSISYFKE